jgi:hypothetical protein
VVGVLALVVLLAAGPQAARATTLEKMTLSEITRRATKAVIGTVVSVTPERHDGGIRTAVKVRVTEPLKNGSIGITTVYVPGGTLPDGESEAVDSMARFTAGEQACVFVDASGQVMAGFQGKVALRNGLVTSTGQPVSRLAAAVKAAAGLSRSSAAPDGFVDPIGASDASIGAASSGLSISSIGPNPVAAGIGATITIAGSGFGDTKGSVSFFYCAGEPRIPATVIDSWSDTRIVCEVPVDIINGYAASPGTGPLIVTTSDGDSTSSNLGITFGYGLFRWKADPSKYPNTQVTYRVHPGSVKLAHELVVAAVEVWNDAGADFRFVDGGVSSSPVLPKDGHNDLFWAGGLPDGVIAAASTYYNASGYLVECNVQFSTASRFSWGDGSDGSNKTMDIESIALHETGHWLFLRDLYSKDDASKVMYGYSDSGSASVKRTLSAGDLAGIRWIYGTAADAAREDTIAPATVSDARANYYGAATIKLTAEDNYTGVTSTHYRLDSETTDTGTAVTVSAVGTHTLDFWSVDYAGNVEATETVAFTVEAAVKAVLGTPSSVTSVRRSHTFTVSGTLKPQDTPGAIVKLYFYHKESGHYRLRKTVSVGVSDYLTYSRYSVRTSLSSRGYWRVRAYHKDVSHLAGYSSYHKIRVK